MTGQFIFTSENMAEVAEGEIKKGIERGIIGYASKVTAFEMTINSSLQFIKNISLFHFVIDFKDGSILT